MKKRVNGDGSVYRVKEGGGWMAAVSYVDPETGKTKRRRKRSRTRVDATQLLREMQRELEDHGRPPDRSRLIAETVEDYLRVREGVELEHGARVADRWAMRIIIDGLGTKPSNDLSVKDVDDFLVAASRGRYSGLLGRDQLKRLRGRLIRAIDNDRRRGLVTRNVAELAVIPQTSGQLVGRRPARALSSDELQVFLGACEGAVGVLADLSGRHGLRPAEARALRWSRIDLDRATVQVDCQINRQNEIVKAKTKRAYRVIRIDDETVSRIGGWQSDQQTAAVHAGVHWTGNVLDLVATTGLGTPLNQRNVHRSLQVLSRNLGIVPPVSGYDLRHTAITFQVEKGHPVHQIADWAGTSERMIIDVYRHKINAVTDLGPSFG